MFWTTVALIPFLAIATWTDIRRQMIYNWTMYPAILVAIAANVVVLREEGLKDSLTGLAVCGGVAVVCFVFLPDLGGGDVKLIAALGAGLGFRDGFEAMLWTFVIGMTMAVAILIWQQGAWTLLMKALRRASHVLRGGRGVPVKEEDQKMLQQPLFLAPSALIALFVVRWDVLLAGP
jgi:Flp pilus assembly protein protease CpaA